MDIEVSLVPLNKPEESSRAAQMLLTAPRFLALRFPQPQVATVKATGAVRALACVVLLFGLGALVFAALGQRNRLFGTSIYPAPIIGLFGLLFVFAGVRTGIVNARRVWSFERHAGILRMHPAPKGMGSEIRLSDIAALQILVAETGTVMYETNLVLSEPMGKRLSVMCHVAEPAMRADAEKLAFFLQVPLLDHTREPAMVEGHEFPIEKILVQNRIASSTARALRSRGTGQMAVIPALGPRIIKALVTLVGLAAIGGGAALGVAAARKSGWGGLVGFLFPSLIGVGFILVARLATRPPIVFDRVRGSVRGKGLKFDERIQGQMPLHNISALQLCSGTVRGSENHLFPAFELNLVLVEPPGQRIWLITRQTDRTLRRDAERLAQFLGVPLLDHTGPE